MTTDIKKATPDNTIVDSTAMLRDEDVGALAVVQDGIACRLYKAGSSLERFLLVTSP